MVKILLIDDEMTTCKCTQMVLKRKGYELVYETDADKAYERYKTESPDLLMLDVNLGEGKKTGVDILRQIREEDKVIKVIMMSGMSNTEVYVKESKELGAKDFIDKPVQLDKLVSRIEKVLAEE